MNRNDIVMGAVILAVLAGGFLLLRRDTTPVLEPQASPSVAGAVEQQIEDAFKVDIPDDVEKTELEAVGDSDGSGLATRKFENSEFMATVLADLPPPTSGRFYQVWLASDDQFHSLGRMSVAKGGYLLNYTDNEDHSEFPNVVISEETSVGGEPTNRVLEGSF